MSKKFLKTIIAITTLGLASTAFANSSTMLVKNHTTDAINIEVYGDKHSFVISKNILKSKATDPEPWIIPHWFWQDDYFDYIDFFYVHDGEKFSCGTIEPQRIPWGTTINRAVVVTQCDAGGLQYNFIDMFAAT